MRHGQTYFNIWHKIQGWCDSPLTPEGIKQVQNAGKYLNDHHIIFDKAYCSTAERASDTLEIATNHQLPYTRLKGLREHGFGSFEAQDERLNPPLPYKDFFVKYGGESDQEVGKRLYQTIFKILKDNSDAKNILVVSHAGAIYAFTQAIHFDIRRQYTTRFSNCAFIVFNYENGKLSVETVVNPN